MATVVAHGLNGETEATFEIPVDLGSGAESAPFTVYVDHLFVLDLQMAVEDCDDSDNFLGQGQCHTL